MIDSVDENLLKKMSELDARYEELLGQMNDPAVSSDGSKIIEISRESGRLRRLIEPYRNYCKVRTELQEHRAIAEDSTQDPELRDLAYEEMPDLEKKHDALLEAMKEAIVISDDATISSVLIEIRAGTGGDEAALFARDLYEMYLRYCERMKFKVEVLDQSGGDLGGLKEIVMSIKGEGVYRALGYEGGGHRVQRVPETESQGRIHTSAATVAVLPEPEEIDININWDTEVEEFVSRAGGPGGQNVNKVSSAIRLVHKDTGITVSMRDEKSQHKNRAKARRLMTTRLYDHVMSAQRQERDSARRTMIGSGDRSQRIRTYNFPQNRCTDHRINKDLYSLDRIIQGELDSLIEALQTYDKEQRLRNL